MELLLPPRAVGATIDVEGAVRDALRFPLAGQALQALVPRAGPVTILLDTATLPLPPPARDPRQTALAAVVDELAGLGVARERLTVLVTAGLARRPGRSELLARLGPAVGRRLPGRARAHDAESPELVEVGEHDGRPLRVDRALVETGAIVVVTSAETVLHGGPATLLAAASGDSIRDVAADPSLLEAGGQAWKAALALERALARNAPLIGVSLALAHPRWGGALRSFPYERAAVERLAASPVLRGFRLLPSVLRRRTLLDLRPETGVHAVFAGAPSVAHAEALLRGVELRSRALARPLGTLVVGVPPMTPHFPLERPNPLTVAYLALGLTLRLWRGRFPLADGGTLILQHRLHRRFAHPTQAPYRAFFAALRASESREPELLAGYEAAAAADPSAIEAYRDGRSCHPLLPFAEWDACAPARRRLGAILVAGCRDATAARQLGFVPVRSLQSALEMSAATAAAAAGTGCLPVPPFTPLSLGE